MATSTLIVECGAPLRRRVGYEVVCQLVCSCAGTTTLIAQS